MKKLILPMVMVTTLVLGACGNEATNKEKPTVQETSGSELAFKVNGKEKSIEAKTIDMKNNNVSVKTPEGFKVDANPDGDILNGTGKYKGFQIVPEKLPSTGKVIAAKSSALSATKVNTNELPKEVKLADFPKLKDKYDAYYIGQNNEFRVHALRKNVGKDKMFGLTIKVPVSQTSEETDALVRSIAETYKFEQN
ncbi:hypothetical protein [Bacillus cereus group sp. TH152-1LC]|uniref:hypothetical protein n=1 Tax=Bacillus cereus group sp. TH152-1LC TaxID=3018060 RepID=UPI0022E293F8|nr:hypothetical protein [Bacillus cereus group sp. TH152-1LC]MDA1675243.1 hypothetical protein [Bacillus cereus group sp. TH152-1LC]